MSEQTESARRTRTGRSPSPGSTSDTTSRGSASTSTSRASASPAPPAASGRCGRRPTRSSSPGRASTPSRSIKAWKENFPDFWPKGGQFYGPMTGVVSRRRRGAEPQVGGGAKLSTGMLVLYADDKSFSFMTPKVTCSPA